MPTETLCIVMQYESCISMMYPVDKLLSFLCLVGLSMTTIQIDSCTWCCSIVASLFIDVVVVTLLMQVQAVDPTAGIGTAVSVICLL